MRFMSCKCGEKRMTAGDSIGALVRWLVSGATGACAITFHPCRGRGGLQHFLSYLWGVGGVGSIGVK